MAGILTDLKNTIIAGIVLVIVSVLILMGAYGEGYSNTYEWWAFFVRWLHVLSGIMWIGILWYFLSFSLSLPPTMKKIQILDQNHVLLIQIVEFMHETTTVSI